MMSDTLVDGEIRLEFQLLVMSDDMNTLEVVFWKSFHASSPWDISLTILIEQSWKTSDAQKSK